ncbi:MAG TPA: NAD(P)-binding domain-containing protein [Pseudonocardiaceae bacterium]|nr:NAD(P)-binding domain-containing protein [Pseudonocardiaceae bacterium]
MKIGIIGAGRIGGNAARMFTRAGHEVLVSFSRDPDTLPALAAELGDRARVGTAAEAATFGPVRGPGLCRPVPVSPALRNRTTRLKVRSERGTLPRHGGGSRRCSTRRVAPGYGRFSPGT